MKLVLEEIKHYKKDIKSLGIKDYEVNQFKLNSCRILGKIFISLIRLVISLLFIFPGLLSLIPLGIMVKVHGEKERIKALKASIVKVKGVDVVASKKILFCMKYYPVYCIIFTVVLYFLMQFWSDWGFFTKLMMSIWFIIF